MKSSIFIRMTMIFLFVLSYALVGQSISPEQKQMLINKIINGTNNQALDAIIQIRMNNLNDCAQVVFSNLWKHDPVVRLNFLKALYEFDYPDIHNLALAYIDSLGHYKYSEEDISEAELKSSINTVLFNLNDFSKKQFVFDYVKTISPDLSKEDIYLLEKILVHNPSDTAGVKTILINAACNSDDDLIRWIAIRVLDDHYGQQVLSVAMQLATNDTVDNNRGLIIEEIIGHYNNSTVHSFLATQLSRESFGQNINSISEILLSQYGTPSDYLSVKSIQPTLNDTLYKSYIKIVLLDDFHALQPSSNTTVSIILDTLNSYTQECYSLSWFGGLAFLSQLQGLLNDSKIKFNSGDSLGTAIKIKQYQSLINQAYKDSTAEKYVTSDGYKFLYYYPQYILERLPKIPTVKLESSTGALLIGGNLQYYEGGWKDAIDNGDGTFSVSTKQKIVSLRMTYSYGSQTKTNVTVGTDTVVFQTVNTRVQLQNSLGTALDTGKVQYYAGVWREFGTTADGTASKELLPGNYSFRMSYAYASTDKAQDISVNPNVVFQTVNANVQLQNSSGNLIDQGTVQYYSGAWRDFGVTTNGVASKELLPNNYSFRMTYAYASTDKQQDLKTNPTVVFQTVNAQVQLKNSLGNLIDAGTVQYYSGAWRDFGATANGIASKELLPNNYSFRMTYAYASTDKQQNLKTNPTVVFQTVNAQVQLKNSLGNLIDAGTVQYYSGAWREFGATTNGIALKELLPNNYSFRMTHEYISKDISQNVGTNNIVNFSTVLCTIHVKDTQNNPVSNAAASYYSGTWRQIGLTVNGEITKELLPANLTFRVNYNSTQKDKAQDITTNNIVEFGF
jgi:hypothetical protein